jgi:site-specific DNA-methyltransferase (adenine-specific)
MEQKNVDIIYDCLDEAAMMIYEALRLDYLHCLIRVIDDIVKGTNESGLSLETVEKLEAIYNKFSQHSFVNEEIRLALELLIIKAFKHKGNYSLDLMTPDSVAFLFAYLVNKIGDNKITIMDVALGTGNLINAICNYYEHDCDLIGIEKDQNLCELARACSDLQDNNMRIYCNDNIFPNYDRCDIVIGDLDGEIKDDKYHPYEVITKFWDNLEEDGFFIYLIPNDFFNQKGANEFKSNFKGTFTGLIVLPSTMFSNNHVGKSILIGTKKHIDKYDLLLVDFPSLNNQEKVKETIVMIDQWIKNLKGMIV